MNSIIWGPFSVTLLVLSIQGMLLVGLLLSSSTNRSSNGFLAAFLSGVVLLTTPFTIGFAGFYDAFKWLNFAPFYWDLGFGPLVWLYVRQMGRSKLPPHLVWHFVPMALEVSYYFLVWVLLPTIAKESYNDHVHVVFVLPALRLARYLSYLSYGILTFKTFSRYQAWLAEHSGLREEFRMRWLAATLALIACIALAQASTSLLDAVSDRVTYRNQFPLYLAFSGLVWILGLEGWRHSIWNSPKMDLSEPRSNQVPVGQVLPAESLATDWRRQAEVWVARMDLEAWWREPTISLATVARRLGTNTAYLSRALNEGAGQNFSSCISFLRVRAAEQLLLKDTEKNVLDIGLDVGFASKASFNRVFKLVTGKTPSEYRKSERLISKKEDVS